MKSNIFCRVGIVCICSAIFLNSCIPLKINTSPNGSKDKLAFTYKSIEKGVELECLDSHSGKCYFLVNGSACETSGIKFIYKKSVCTKSEVEILLPIGEKKVLPFDIRNFSICSSEKIYPKFPLCLESMEKISHTYLNKFGVVTWVFPYPESL